MRGAVFDGTCGRSAVAGNHDVSNAYEAKANECTYSDWMGAFT